MVASLRKDQSNIRIVCFQGTDGSTGPPGSDGEVGEMVF